jgi:hypothetical protein
MKTCRIDREAHRDLYYDINQPADLTTKPETLKSDDQLATAVPGHERANVQQALCEALKRVIASDEFSWPLPADTIAVGHLSLERSRKKGLHRLMHVAWSGGFWLVVDLLQRSAP